MSLAHKMRIISDGGEPRERQKRHIERYEYILKVIKFQSESYGIYSYKYQLNIDVIGAKTLKEDVHKLRDFLIRDGFEAEVIEIRSLFGKLKAYCIEISWENAGVSTISSSSVTYNQPQIEEPPKR